MPHHQLGPCRAGRPRCYRCPPRHQRGGLTLHARGHTSSHRSSAATGAERNGRAGRGLNWPSIAGGYQSSVSRFYDMSCVGKTFAFYISSYHGELSLQTVVVDSTDCVRVRAFHESRKRVLVHQPMKGVPGEIESHRNRADFMRIILYL